MGSADSVCLKDDCPDEVELDALMRGATVDGKRLSWLEQRLSECEGCQQRLENLGTGRSETVEVVIGSQSNNPARIRSEALAAVMQKAKAGDFIDTESAGTNAEPDLSFLEADGEGDSLGRLGKYSVIEVIAEGGMGLVLRAEDPDLHREVAIKVLSPRLAKQARARELFLREARSAAGVEHENVLPIYLVEKSDDLPWFVMPLVRGGTVEDRIAEEGELPFDEVLDLSLKTSRGLAAAHAKGLVHRDIKPANIMLDPPSGNVWLADFGLAAAVETDGATGQIAGTPGYMAPEVVAGETPDERSDLFSLGCVLFAMASGRQAFSGDTVEQLLDAVASEEPAPVSGEKGQVPPWFAELIGKLLVKPRDDRLGTAEELVGILESRVEESRKAVWRNRMLRRVKRGLAMAALAVALIGGTGWLLAVTGKTQGVNRILATFTGDAFSVKGRFGLHESLGEAARVASDGAIIEIFGDDSWDTHPVRVEGKSLTIRPAGGNVPTLSAVSENSTMIWTDSNLEIEGIVMEHSLRPRKSMPSLVSSSGPELRIRNCRLLSLSGPRDPEGLGLLVGAVDCRLVDLERVEIQVRHSYGIGIKNKENTEPQTVRLRHVVFIGPMMMMLYDDREQREIRGAENLEGRIEIENCTVMSDTLLHLASRGAAYRTAVRVQRSVMDCRVGLVTNLGSNEAAARQLLSWEDRENLYAIHSGMFFGQGRGTLGNPMRGLRSTRLGWDDVVEWWGLEGGGSTRVDRIFSVESRERFKKLGPLELDELIPFPGLSLKSQGADFDRVGPIR